MGQCVYVQGRGRGKGTDLVPHVGVGGRHVHLEAQRGRVGLDLAVAHVLEQLQTHNTRGVPT